MMDTTKEYIKMCEKATKIQNVVEFKNGDFVHCTENDKTVILYFNVYICMPPEKYIDKETSIFLPRQDQLQDMLKGTAVFLETDYQVLFCFYKWYFDNDDDVGFEDFSNYSIEQMWLSFIMKMNFNKVWNGEDWVKA